jgi:hypothetical protein
MVLNCLSMLNDYIVDPNLMPNLLNDNEYLVKFVGRIQVIISYIIIASCQT